MQEVGGAYDQESPCRKLLGICCVLGVKGGFPHQFVKLDIYVFFTLFHISKK